MKMDHEGDAPGSCRSSATSISEKAFTIFLGETTNHAMIQNNEIRRQNANMEMLRDLLLKVQIFCGGETLWSGKLENYRDDDQLDHYLTLPVNGIQPFHIDKLGDLWCQVSGVAIMLPDLMKRTMHWGSRHTTTVLQDGTLEVVLKLSSAFCLVGLVEDCTGTTRDLQCMIDNNALMYHLSHLGYVSESTGLPSQSTRGTFLDGSTFRPTKIILYKSVVESTLRKVNGSSVRKHIGEETASEFEELCNLYQTSKKCSSSLRFVVEERRLLFLEHALLKSCMNRLDTIEIRYPGGPVMKTQLGGGKPSTGPNGNLTWKVEISRANGTIPFQSVRQMKIYVAGFPIDADCWPQLHGVTVDDEFTVLCLPYTPCVEAVFIFDSSWDDHIVRTIPNVEDVGGFVDRLRNQLVGYSEPPPGHELTMRLWFVRFRFDVVHRQLEALGIHFNQNKVT